MKFSHFVPNKISYTMICILLFFFLSKFYVIFTKFLKVSGTRKYFIKFSACRTKFPFNNWRMEQFIFVSVHVLVRGVVEHPWQYINWKSLDFLCIGWVPIFAWCCLNCSMCFHVYSFVWVAISIDNASGIKIFKKYISHLLFSITVVGPVNSVI